MAVLLIGQEAEGNVGAALTKVHAFRFKCNITGTGETFKATMIAGGTSKTLRVALYNDSAEGKVPGTYIAGSEQEKTIVEGAAETVTFTITSTLLEKGVFYWLAITPGEAKAIKFKYSTAVSGTTSVNVLTPANSREPKAVLTWNEDTRTPGPIWVEGTESGAIQTSPKVAMELAVKAIATGGGGIYNLAAKVESQLEVLTEIQSQGSPSEKESGLYYGSNSLERVAEEAKGHNARILDAWGAPSAGAATIVSIHGGGLGPGNRNEVEAVPKKLNEHGYCVFSIDYRYASTTEGALGEGVSETARTLSDVEEAVTYAKNNAEAHNGNPNNIYLLGGSAGGLLAALAAIKMNATEAKVKGVIGFSAYGNIKAFLEEMESGKYNEPGGGHAGGSANDLIQHTQWGFQQELNYTNSSGEGTGPPVVTFSTKTSAAGDRTVQKNKSPTLITIAKAIRWFQLFYKEDLIPAVQQSELKSHLETEKQIQVKTHEQTGTGHGWGMFASNINIRNEVFEFIEAPIAVPAVEMGLEVKAAFVGVTPGGGGTGRSPFLEIATGGKHSKFRTRT